MPDAKILSKDRASGNVSTTTTKSKKMVLQREKSQSAKVSKKSVRYLQALLRKGKMASPIRTRSQQHRKILNDQRKKSKQERQTLSSRSSSQKSIQQNRNRRSMRDNLRKNRQQSTRHSATNMNQSSTQRSNNYHRSVKQITSGTNKSNTQMIIQQKQRREMIREQKKKDRDSIRYTHKGYEYKKAPSQKLTKQGSASDRQTTGVQNKKNKHQSMQVSGTKRREREKQKHTRQAGKKKSYGVKNMRQKVQDSLKKEIKPKNQFKNYFKEMIIDKIGTDSDGNLNFIGFILAVILLVPMLITFLIVIVIMAIVATIVAIFITVWMFIASLFVIKTEAMAMTEAYMYITWLDTHKNKDVYDRYQQLVADKTNEIVYFEVNGIQSDPEKFMFASNGDNYLYYLNAKYEDYDITNTAIATYRKRIADKTGVWIPWSMRNSTYAVFQDAPHPTTSEPIKVYKVKDEIHAVHDMIYNYTTKIEKDKEIETVTVTVDKETGEEKTEIKTEKKTVATVEVNVKTIGEMFDTKPEVDVYSLNKHYGSVLAFDDEEVDKYYPIMELERFEDKIFMRNPFGKKNYATVVDNFGYRRRDESVEHYQIALEAEPGTPVYATTTEEVDDIDYEYRAGHTDGSVPTTTAIETDTGDYYAYYVNVDPVVRPGTDLKEGDLIGYTKDQFDGNLLLAMKEYRFWHKDPNVYPAIYIDKLVFANDTNLAYLRNGGGLRGELINPPEKVMQWREKVVEETKKQDISSYTNAVLSMIWVESGGDQELTKDIMNVKNAVDKPITVTTPEQSIELGVAQFADLLKKAEKNTISPLAAVQAYNYGEAYLDDLIKRNAPHTFENSKYYAQEKSNSQTVPFNHSVALTLGYTWRYNFGNMFYAPMVTRNISGDTGKLAEIAIKELGNANGEKYWRWAGFENRMEWSAVFVSWVANEAGYLDQGRVLQTPSVLNMFNWFKEEEKFKGPEEEYTPQSGDIVFFDWAGGKTGKDHVGIVEYADGNIVQVIEGNSNNLVRRKTYSLTSNVISGYGIP